MAQHVVVVQILVAQHNAKDPLPYQRLYRVLDQLRPPMIPEAGGKALHQPDRPIRRPQQQTASVRRDGSTIKGRLNRAPVDSANPNRSTLHCVCIGNLLC